MTDFESRIRGQLEAYQRMLADARASGQADQVLLVRNQIGAYCLGLRTCLSDRYIDRLLAGFDLD